MSCSRTRVTPVRLEPAAARSQSRVKHSTTEPLRSQVQVYRLEYTYNNSNIIVQKMSTLCRPLYTYYVKHIRKHWFIRTFTQAIICFKESAHILHSDQQLFYTLPQLEPVRQITNNVVCATSKASDHPAHTRSLIRALASRLSII